MALKIKRRVAPLDENQKRQRQIAIIAIFLTVALFFIGYQIGKNSASAEAKSTSKKSTKIDFNASKSKTEVSDLGPSKFDFVIPTGFAKTEDGAKKAAATYIESWPQLLSSTDYDVVAAINYVTTSGSTDLRQALGQSIESGRLALSGAIAGGSYHQSVPLKLKVESSDSKSATITIWSMELWAAAGKLEAQSSFALQTLKLVYADNDWKIDSWLTVPGPTPQWAYAVPPSNTLDFIGDLANFEEYKR